MNSPVCHKRAASSLLLPHSAFTGISYKTVVDHVCVEQLPEGTLRFCLSDYMFVCVCSFNCIYLLCSYLILHTIKVKTKTICQVFLFRIDGAVVTHQSDEAHYTNVKADVVQSSHHNLGIATGDCE